MKENPKILGVVCCRGGSKGLPGKNIKPLAGKPLLGWTLEQARDAGIFTDLACSSDDDAILAVAREYGANILIKRPDDLATDEAGALPALTHAVREAMREAGTDYDYIVLLQATSPLRLPSDIQAALQLAQDSGAPSVVSATPSRQSPYYTIYEQNADGKFQICKSNPKGTLPRRQDAPPTYDLNGSIYVWPAKLYLDTEQTMFPDTQLYIMPEERSVDIDTARDFLIAEISIEKGLWQL